MRKFRTREEWQALIEEQNKSGKSAAQFCREKNIHPNLFYKRRSETGSGSFVKLPAIHVTDHFDIIIFTELSSYTFFEIPALSS